MNRKDAIEILSRSIARLREFTNDDDLAQLDLPFADWFLWGSSWYDYRLSLIEDRLDKLLEQEHFRCRLQEPAAQDFMHLMTSVGPAERRSGINYLREGLGNPYQVTICDPYLLRGRRDMTAADLINGLDELIPQSTRKLEIFIKPRARDVDIAGQVNELCRRRRLKITCRRTEQFHDRVWLADDQVAWSVGASFNGLGHKPAFILRIPDEDCLAFVRVVRELRESLPVSRSA